MLSLLAQGHQFRSKLNHQSWHIYRFLEIWWSNSLKSSFIKNQDESGLMWESFIVMIIQMIIMTIQMIKDKEFVPQIYSCETLKYSLTTGHHI